MSVTLSDRPVDVTDHPGVPFGRLVRTELRKLTDTRAGRWLLIAIMAITPLVVVGTLIWAPTKDLTYDKFLDFTQTPQKILLPVLGILAITSEWSQRTGLVTFTLTPNRGRVLLAKVVATLGLGLVVIAIMFATAAIGNVLGVALRHGNGSWSFGAGGLGGGGFGPGGLGEIALVQLTGLLEGMAFGMLLLGSAAAIVCYYAVPNLWSLLFNSVSPLKGSAHWIDLNKAQSPLYTHDMTGQAWARVLVAVALWVAVPLALGLVRVLRSEVKSS